MAEHRLKPLCPLGGTSPARASIGPVTLTEVVDVALASVSARLGRRAEVAASAAAAGIPLPGPGRFEARAPFAAFWLSPDSWMVEAPFATHEDSRAALLPVFGDAASITEQTDAWVRIDVTGEGLPALFERLCNVDLATAPEGAATRTILEHMGVYVVKRGAAQVSVIGARSSAAALWHALDTAAHSVF